MGTSSSACGIALALLLVTGDVLFLITALSAFLLQINAIGILGIRKVRCYLCLCLFFDFSMYIITRADIVMAWSRTLRSMNETAMHYQKYPYPDNDGSQLEPTDETQLLAAPFGEHFPS